MSQDNNEDLSQFSMMDLFRMDCLLYTSPSPRDS